MKAKTKLTKLWSFLLSLVMLLSLLPTTVLAASPDASNVFVDGGKNFYNPGRLYYKKGDQDKNFTGTSTDFNAAYDPATGTLTLKDYNGKGITVGGVGRTDITVVLEGTNIINDGSLENAVGGDITVTSSDGGTLSITRTLSGGNAAIGIETGLSGSYTTGSVTIKGDAEVTIDMTHTGTSTYEKAYGIYAEENITISENASVDITCATPNNTTGGSNCNGMFANGNVSIDTTGKIKIDVTKAGKDDAYSFGIYPMGTPTLTRVGEMQVQWKKHSTHSSYPGGAISRGASFDTTTHAVNVDTINCYASYRFGTPRKVTAQNGQLTGPGVKYENGSGYFLAGDKVNITPAIKKSWDDQEIPFKEWTSSDVTLDKSATTASNSFTVPDKDVTVTAKHSPFVGTPKFTPTGTTGTQGTLTFKTVVKANAAQEGFRLVEEGNENNESSYISIRSDTTSTSSPYEYSYETSIYGLNEGNYYVVAYLNNHYYLGEKVTVSYTAPVTTYTVSFNANGGTGTMVDVTDISGEYTLPENGFTAPAGKQFKAWSVGGVEKAVGDTITVNANTTVTAIWKDAPVTPAINSVTVSPATAEVVKGKTQQFTATVDKTGEIADTVTWSVNSTKSTISDTGLLTVGADETAKTLTVTATSTADTTKSDTATVTVKVPVYYITVTNGKVTDGAGNSLVAVTEGAEIIFTANEPETGKQFKEWTGLDGVEFVDGTSKTSSTAKIKMPARAVTATAVYEDAPNANPAKPTISVNGTYTYTGSEQTATVSGYDSTTMSITGNVGTNAGGYTVSVTSKTGKWADGTTDAVTADWSIQKANPTYEVPTGLEGTKGNALSTVTLPDGFTWANGTTEMNTTGNQTFPATFTPSDAGNYNVVNNISVTVNVKEAAPTTYKVTVRNGTGGGNYEEGATVTLTAGAAPTGQMFDKWVVNGVVVDVNSATTTFVMPAGNVTAEATYKNIPAGPAGHTHSYGSEWKTDADKHWHECSCGAKTEEAAHTASDWITDIPATVTTDGKKHKECTECGYVMETAKIPHIAGVISGAAKYTYSGSVKTPSVKVTDADGNVLVKDTDYSVAYPTGRKAVGKYTVKIVFKGNYEGTKSFSFTIKPKTAKIKSITATSRKLTVKAATKVSATGGTVYQIAYKQKGTSTWKYTTTTSYYKTIKSLKKGKQYYVKMRAYRKSGTTKYYGSWSTVKLSKAVK